MKAYFKRHGWIYVVVAILIVWPALVIWLQLTPAPDLPTARKVAVKIDAYLERHSEGPVQLDAFIAIEQELKPFKDDPRVNRLLDMQQAGGTEALAPDLEAVMRVYGSALDEWDRLAQLGAVYYYPTVRAFDEITAPVPSDPQGRGGNIYGAPNFLNLMHVARIRRVASRQAAIKGDWNGAMEQLEKALASSRPIGHGSMIGHLYAVACQNIALGGCMELLNLNPPGENKRAILAALIESRKYEPILGRTVMVSEGHFAVVMAYFLETGASTKKKSNALVRAASGLLTISELDLRRDKLRGPGVRAAVERLNKYVPILYTEERVPTDMMIEALLKDPRWTSLPAMNRILREVAREEPQLVDTEILPLNEREGLDPLTVLRMLVTRGGINSISVSSIHERTRYAITFARLVELAVAARIFEDEHGRLPGSVDELVPAYVPPYEVKPPLELDHVKLNFAPFAPFQMGTREVTPGLRGAFWKAKLPPPDLRLAKASPFGAVEPDSTIVWLNDDSKLPNFVPLQAIFETLQLHPAIVEEPKAEFTHNHALIPPFGSPLVDGSTDKVVVNGKQVPAPEPEAWMEIDPAQARRMSDLFDNVKWSSVPVILINAKEQKYSPVDENKLPPDKRGSNRPKVDTFEIPPTVGKVTGTYKSPDKLWIIWSPGPDNRDDGGRVSYDPSNGISSTGDMIVFPESF